MKAFALTSTDQPASLVDCRTLLSRTAVSSSGCALRA